MLRQSCEFGGKTLTIETGRMAKQASGAALVTYGETVVLVTAVSSLKEREGIDFFPLSCDYIEKTYSAGKIPGGYFKREGRQTENEILMSRVVDRPLRPLFPEGFKCETQVIALVLSVDKENDPAINAVIGAAAALEFSNIPWNGPVAACRVGRVDGAFVVNPTYAVRGESDVDMLVVAAPTGIVMVEGGAKFVTEEVVIDALMAAQEAVQPVIKLIQDMRAQIGKPKAPFAPKKPAEGLEAAVKAFSWDRIKAAATIAEKLPRYAAMDQVGAETLAALVEQYPGQDKAIKEAVHHLKGEFMRGRIVKEGVRLDGRTTTQVRPITCEIGVLPRTHGSALFTRGETQALVTVTLGTAQDEQRIDALNGDYTKNFLLHYNFPPFSVGEVRPMRGPSRRDTGHGALAERGVKPVLPDFEMFPYTIRIVSEVLESNGSSSMATVCGASLALMDAGAPIASAVGGVAMGLIKEGDDVAILSDILGDEDHLGDMDFKVIGSRDGISGIQMDIKIDGLSREILVKALEQARASRLHILDCMNATISAERPDLSAYAPRIFTILINPERIRDLIGPGGKHIKGIIEKTGVAIDVSDDGKVSVAAVDQTAADRAIEAIKGYTAEPDVGADYLGTVTRITDFGAFVRIMPNVEGLLHVSEMAEHRVERPEDVCKEGDEILVRCLHVDKTGKIRLSRKEVLSGRAPQESYDRGEPSGGRGGDRGGRGGGDRDRRGGGGRERRGGGFRDRD